MSILLEALKKSEEQRRLGQAPSIHSPLAGAPEERSSARRRLVWVLVAVAALTMGWIGWQQYRQPAATVAAEGQPARVTASPDSGSGADRGNGGSPTSEPTRDSPSAGPAAVRQRTPVESLGVETDPDSRVRTADSGEPGTRHQSQTEVARSFTRYKAPPADNPPVVAVSNAGEAPADPAPAQPEEAPPARQERAEPRVPKPVTYWELPQSVRDSLPDLRMTVLVYAEEPADRFVLIGGQRLREEEEYQDGLLLEEIRRDGAVFRYRNYRFLVKG